MNRHRVRDKNHFIFLTPCQQIFNPPAHLSLFLYKGLVGLSCDAQWVLVGETSVRFDLDLTRCLISNTELFCTNQFEHPVFAQNLDVIDTKKRKKNEIYDFPAPNQFTRPFPVEPTLGWFKTLIWSGECDVNIAILSNYCRILLAIKVWSIGWIFAWGGLW